MDNQHRKIPGYRELNQEEIDLIATIKLKGEELRILVDKVQALGTGDAETGRWASIARTHLQQGIMALVRAIALPTTF